MAVLFLVGHEQLNHLVLRAGEAVQAAGGDGSTQLVERQSGAENLDSKRKPFVRRRLAVRQNLFDHMTMHFGEVAVDAVVADGL